MANDSKGGYLTTHVLDTMSGLPASGMAIELFRADGEKRELLHSTKTKSDGRCDEPVLSGSDFSTGTYELRFHVGDYLKDNNVSISEPAFLDVVPLCFGISDATSHYHVPLLVSPYSYSTYRGS